MLVEAISLSWSVVDRGLGRVIDSVAMTDRFGMSGASCRVARIMGWGFGGTDCVRAGVAPPCVEGGVVA